MPKVNKHDREVLSRALRDGGLSVVTHRNGEEAPGGLDELRRLNRLCAEGLLRQDRITGHRYAPVGELKYDYVLTRKGQDSAR
jgi:hypothetical protein